MLLKKGVEVWGTKAGDEKPSLIDKIDIEQFETLDEAQAFFAKRDYGNDLLKAQAYMLERFNAQYNTDCRNTIRQSATATISAKQLSFEAMTKIAKDPALLAQFLAVSDDRIASDKFMAEVTSKIKQEYESRRKAKNDESAAKAEKEGVVEEQVA